MFTLYCYSTPNFQQIAEVHIDSHFSIDRLRTNRQLSYQMPEYPRGLLTSSTPLWKNRGTRNRLA